MYSFAIISDINEDKKLNSNDVCRVTEVVLAGI